MGCGTVSPPMEHVSGSQWWTDYQPVSYTLTSKRGSRAQFSRHRQAPEHIFLPDAHDFHHCGLTSGDDIVDYDVRAQVQTCELDNLADLATETEYVRGRLAQYVNDLISLGVDGLRLDAAKHMATGDISNILGRLTTKPYITQEVIWGSGEPIQPSEYTSNGLPQINPNV
ncbi:hypothetical protein DXG01_004406 [Tephrocybe rancida]|nr:hypothetical protein DXG01_004406 [Tephrocybe rancida]